TVDIIDVSILSIRMPASIRQAIQRTMAEKEALLTYYFTVAKEQKEAERKRIEAEGIQRFQEIISPGITQGLLEWKAIEATSQLARSQNAKVVVIGGRDGLPLLLNLPAETATSPATQSAASQKEHVPTR